MIRFKSIQILFISICSIMLFIGCSNKDNSLSSEEKIWQTYSNNNRLDKYNELIDSYGNNYWILKMNESEDSWWITNLIISFVTYIFPDTAATVTLGGFIWLIIALTGTSLTGGTILMILAKVGKRTPLAFLPASIAGILTIGMILVIFQRLLATLYEMLF